MTKVNGSKKEETFNMKRACNFGISRFISSERGFYLYSFPLSLFDHHRYHSQLSCLHFCHSYSFTHHLPMEGFHIFVSRHLTSYGENEDVRPAVSFKLVFNTSASRKVIPVSPPLHHFQVMKLQVFDPPRCKF